MSCKPTFLLKPSAYKTNKLYAILPDNGDGDLSISSYVGNGTRVRSDGLIEPVSTDRPRIDYHNGVGLLLEPTRTNLNTYSSGLNGWSVSGATNDPNEGTLAPDGNRVLTAPEIRDAQTISAGFVQKIINISDATATHTISFFVKFGDRDTFTVKTYGRTAGTEQHYVNISRDGSIEDYTGLLNSYSSEKYADAWIRFQLTFDIDPSDTSIMIQFYPGSSYDGSFNVGGMGYAHVWGIQLEEGDYATSYIPTEATTLTRSVDYIDGVTPIASNFLGYNNGILSLDFSYNENQDSSVFTMASIGDGTGMVCVYNSTSKGVVASVYNADATKTEYSINSPNRAKIAFNITSTNVDIWVNGLKAASSNKDFLFGSDALLLTGYMSASKIHEMALYANSGSDDELKRMTQ